jgi:SUMO ligase MMS21 Smc5/6 complex component
MPPRHNERPEMSEIEGVPYLYKYIHTLLSNIQFFNHDAYAQDHKYDQDFIQNLMTDEGTTTCLYAICCIVMVLTTMWQKREAY